MEADAKARGMQFDSRLVGAALNKPRQSFFNFLAKEYKVGEVNLNILSNFVKAVFALQNTNKGNRVLNQSNHNLESITNIVYPILVRRPVVVVSNEQGTLLNNKLYGELKLSPMNDPLRLERFFGSLFTSPLVYKDSIPIKIFDHMRTNVDHGYQPLSFAAIAANKTFNVDKLPASNIFVVPPAIFDGELRSEFSNYIDFEKNGSLDDRLNDFNRIINDTIFLNDGTQIPLSSVKFDFMDNIFYDKLNALAEQVLIGDVELRATLRNVTYNFTETSGEILLFSTDYTRPFTLTSNMVKKIQIDFKSGYYYISSNNPVIIESYLFNNEATEGDQEITKEMELIADGQTAQNPNGNLVEIVKNNEVNLLEFSFKEDGLLQFKYKFKQGITPNNFLRDANLLITLKNGREFQIDSIGANGKLKGGDAKVIWGEGISSLPDLECTPGRYDTFWANQEINCTWAANLWTSNYYGGTGLFTLGEFETKKMCRNPNGYKFNYTDSLILIDENELCPEIINEGSRL